MDNNRINLNSSTNKDFLYKKDDEKTKKIRSILGYEDEIFKPKKVDSKIKVNYNQTVYFEKPKNFSNGNSSEKQIERLISNVFNNSSNPPLLDKIEKGSNIKFNFNINNNYYNANYNVVDSKNERNTAFNIEPASNRTNDGPRLTYNNSGNRFSNTFNKNNNYNENIHNKRENDIIIPAYKRKEYLNDETMVQSKSGTFLNTFSNNNLRKSVCTNTLTSSNNFNSNSNYNINNQVMINFIPCINCNNMISIDDIDSHSNFCLQVKQEVIQAETSQFTYHAIEYKLKKLLEHITSIKNNQINLNSSSQMNVSNVNYSMASNAFNLSLGESKDTYAIISLHKYLSDAAELSKIEHSTITALKKILTNIDTLTVTFKGPFSTLVLIERARILVFDKVKVFKEDLKKKLQTKKANEKTSGALVTIKLKELEQKVQENQKLKESVDNEKELWKNKAVNLKRNSSTKKPELLHKYNNINYRSPERKTNLIQNPINNNSNRDSVISTLNYSRNLNNNNNENLIETIPLVANRKEALDRSVTESINKDNPLKIMNNNNENFVSPIANSANKSMNKSAISDDNVSDYEERNPRLNAKKVNNKKIIVSDINSDVEGLSQKLDDSDITSMASSASVTSFAESGEFVSSFKNMDINASIAKNNPEIVREKARYMQFLKVLLKIKFQKLHNSHLGQQVPAKPVYQEAKRQNVSQENWQDFILNEIKQPQKYMKFIKADKLKVKKTQGINSGLDLSSITSPDFNGKKNDLFVIDEESNLTQL